MVFSWSTAIIQIIILLLIIVFFVSLIRFLSKTIRYFVALKKRLDSIDEKLKKITDTKF